MPFKGGERAAAKLCNNIKFIFSYVAQCSHAKFAKNKRPTDVIFFDAQSLHAWTQWPTHLVHRINCEFFCSFTNFAAYILNAMWWSHNYVCVFGLMWIPNLSAVLFINKTLSLLLLLANIIKGHKRILFDKFVCVHVSFCVCVGDIHFGTLCCYQFNDGMNGKNPFEFYLYDDTRIQQTLYMRILCNIMSNHNSF